MNTITMGTPTLGHSTIMAMVKMNISSAMNPSAMSNRILNIPEPCPMPYFAPFRVDCQVARESRHDPVRPEPMGVAVAALG